MTDAANRQVVPFTPGPWKVMLHSDDDNWTINAPDADIHVAFVERNGCFANANARLIAAAPELLELVQQWLTVFSPDDIMLLMDSSTKLLARIQREK